MSKKNIVIAKKGLSAITPFLLLLGMIICLLGYREWHENKADSHRIIARAVLCKVVGKPLIPDSDPPHCEFEVHLSQSLFSSNYHIWISENGGTVEYIVPPQQIISVEVK